MKDYYKILGVDKKASGIEIKKTFREKAVLIHPDKSKSNTKDEFIELYEAYAILSNKKKKDKYDKLYNLFLNRAPEVKDEGLKRDVKSISEKGLVYANDFKKFDREVLGLIFLELFFGHDNLLYASVVTVFFGIWTILKGLISLELVYTLIGCLLTLIGLFFGKLKIDKVRKITR